MGLNLGCTSPARYRANTQLLSDPVCELRAQCQFVKTDNLHHQSSENSPAFMVPDKIERNHGSMLQNRTEPLFVRAAGISPRMRTLVSSVIDAQFARARTLSRGVLEHLSLSKYLPLVTSNGLGEASILQSRDSCLFLLQGLTPHVLSVVDVAP